jgi:DNA-binding transcriptional ArsR family regulator
MLEQLRHLIQTRVDELTDEIDRLRRALRALDPHAAAGTPKAPASKPARPASPARTTRTRRAGSTRRTSGRTAPGATKAAILEALAGGEAMTASEVAAKAGLERATVSTTLSKLASSGEIQKADRGYRVAA